MPSFATDSPLDYNLKKWLITETLKKLCLTRARKKAYKQERKAKLEERLLKPQRKLDSSAAIGGKPGEEERKFKAMLKEQAREARENERKKRAIIRERNEAAVKSQYTLIYPLVSYEHE
jgi:hypothetical protein